MLESKNKPVAEKEPSRVEKLVKGDDSANRETFQDVEFQEQPQERSRQVREMEMQFDGNKEKPQSVQIQTEQTQKTIPSNITTQNKNITLNENITPEQIQAINAELAKKYGNNLDAEVSEEDLQKIIEQLMPIQNR
ncbi:MAG: hypothetical protein DKM23_06740 [Candidatus Melainabacteria bacterium]|nr:MAG: hypothetical protein DKM23_06740 [Candidatus Melainabacteria bacterium]